MENESNLKNFSRKSNTLCLHRVKFWSFQTEASADLIKVMKTGFKILKRINNANKRWDQLQEIIPNIPDSLKLYANFHLYVLNNKTPFKTLFDKSNDYLLTKNYRYNAFNQVSVARSIFLNDGHHC